MDECFVICPIGEAGTETRERSDLVFKHLVEPIAQKFHLKAFRGHDIGEPGIITSQVITKIIDAKLVIADLTDQNPNVFYELAIRHAVHKPCVQVIQHGQKEPFNVHGLRSVPYSIDRIDLVDQARVDIEFHVKAALEPGHRVQSPVSQAIDLQSLRESSNPQGRQIAELAASMERLEAIVSRSRNFSTHLYTTETMSPFDIESQIVDPNDIQMLRNLHLKFRIDPEDIFSADLVEVKYKDGNIRKFPRMRLNGWLATLREITRDKNVLSIQSHKGSRSDGIPVGQ